MVLFLSDGPGSHVQVLLQLLYGDAAHAELLLFLGRHLRKGLRGGVRLKNGIPPKSMRSAWCNHRAKKNSFKKSNLSMLVGIPNPGSRGRACAPECLSKLINPCTPDGLKKPL
jgi:hypothetical protein